jgi:hypothetical protein
MNTKVTDYLNSVEISHLFAKNYNHGVETKGKWDLFEPTRFVYAFFAFNMIYTIDWQSTILKNRLIYHKNNNDNTAKKQIQQLIQFIYNNNENEFESALNKIDPNRELFAIVSSMSFDYNSGRDNIRNTGNSIAKDFLNASEKFSNNETLDKNDHFDLLQMSYAVRNNLFHGEKKAHQMKELGHRNRLFYYANIILATNESFFEIMKNKYSYRRMEDWEIQNNL